MSGPSRVWRRAAPALAAFAALSIAVPSVAAAAPGGIPGRPAAKPKPPIEVQILALNDFHGNLEGGTLNTGGTPSGGAEYLATHVAQKRATNPNTVVVSAGDLIGASPLLSALFHDEPTIEAMNAIGLDINAVGNHEFDEGAEELLRMANGGCREGEAGDVCRELRTFTGADFDFLAANVRWEDTGKTVFPPYVVKDFERGAKIAFVGMTLEGTPTIVTPEGVAGLTFADEADTVNALVGELERRRVENIVVLLHEGGFAGGGINGCTNISGPIVDIVNRMHAQIDAVITGHTHAAYNCIINDIPVTSASSFGRVLTDMDVTIDPDTRRITKIKANNGIVTRDVPPTTAITDIIERYRPFYAPLANRIIGLIQGGTVISRSTDAAGESPMGRVIADSQLEATTPAHLGGAQVAFMNPGGVRADLVGNANGEVTYEAAFTVQPFGNSLVTMNLSGMQIDRMLEEQFCGGNDGVRAGHKVLQVSAGFTYTYDGLARGTANCDDANAVAFESIQLHGQPLVATQIYRVTVNSFLATGGDNFPVLAQGTSRLGGALDLDALESYFTARPEGVLAPTDPRITRLN
ncbi:bifunctional UDP-sugar hydrolase/5'-nucleotidase [Egicoccus sp. AB-alg6-2]|uniref:bifunctional metallophosphatase/5'-nucleotidase n=1 Tax=Egicoccus sp. AB-alg6-2 TaxID=3242692 RepID=UPI00359E04C8